MDLLSLALLLQLSAPVPELPTSPPPAETQAASAASTHALPMPAPPPGMHPLSPGEAPPAAEAQTDAADDTDEEGPGSDEMEEVRAAEQLAIDANSTDTSALQAFSRLGLGNPLRARLEDGIEDWTLREDHSPLDLGPVKDLRAFDVSQVAGEYDIPVEMQPLVAQYIRFFQGPGRRWFRTWMERSHRYIPMMRPILEKAGVPGDTVYLAMIESGFSTDAYSWAHAVGPWQFIAPTGKHFGLREDFWVDERRDPLKSTLAAAQYLHQLHEDLGDWYLAWAAYNTGGGRIRRLAEKKGTRDFWELSDGRGLALETKHYVPKLIACALVAKHPRAFGFDADDFHYEDPLQYDQVKLVDPTDLAVIARAAGTTVRELKELNPELRRWCTPPATADDPYVLRLPKGTAAEYAQNIARVAPRQRLTYRVYRVRHGDTLGQIARNFHTPTEAILSVNHLSSARRLKINAELVVPVPLKGNAVPAELLADAREKETPKVSRRALTKALVRSRQQPAARPELAQNTPRPMAHGTVETETVSGRTRLSYGVSEGDTLWSISQRFGCTVDELRRWNHLGSHARLQTGATLTVWPKAQIVSSRRTSRPLVAQSSPTDASSVHRIQAGETLGSVAHRYGVSVDDLARWNGLDQGAPVKPGQQLTLTGP